MELKRSSVEYSTDMDSSINAAMERYRQLPKPLLRSSDYLPTYNSDEEIEVISNSEIETIEELIPIKRQETDYYNDDTNSNNNDLINYYNDILGDNINATVIYIPDAKPCTICYELTCIFAQPNCNYKMCAKNLACISCVNTWFRLTQKCPRCNTDISICNLINNL